MSKKFVQDVVANVVSIRRPKEEDPEEDIEDDVPEYKERPKKRAWASLLFVVGGAVVILIAFFALSSIYSSVTIKVTTSHKSLVVDELAFLTKDGKDGGIKYDVMKLSDVESVSVPLIGTKTVQRAATGQVVIYNSYSSTPQKLVVGTRLETKDGKIFKIDKAVTIPGLTITAGKVVPGSIAVTVKASQIGPGYNIPPSEFTIPGLKGSTKYSKITARSSKSMTGGYSGEIKTASAASIQTARLKLEESLRQKLTKNALLQVPDGMLLYPDATVLNFTNNVIDGTSLSGSGTGQPNLQVTGTLSAILIDATALREFILSKELPDSGDVDIVVVRDQDKLSVKIVNKDKVVLDGSASVLVKLSGTINAIWTFDEVGLKNKLSGIKKSNYQTVFGAYPFIEKAEATVSPSWALYFPGDVSRIKIDKGF